MPPLPPSPPAPPWPPFPGCNMPCNSSRSPNNSRLPPSPPFMRIARRAPANSFLLERSRLKTIGQLLSATASCSGSPAWLLQPSLRWIVPLTSMLPLARITRLCPGSPGAETGDPLISPSMRTSPVQYKNRSPSRERVCPAGNKKDETSRLPFVGKPAVTSSGSTSSMVHPKEYASSRKSCRRGDKTIGCRTDEALLIRK